MADERHFLKSLFDKAVAAAQAENLIPGRMPPLPKGRTVVIGAGKAAAAMARAVEHNWSGELSGLVITPYGHSVVCDQIDVSRQPTRFPMQRDPTPRNAFWQ